MSFVRRRAAARSHRRAPARSHRAAGRPRRRLRAASTMVAATALAMSPVAALADDTTRLRANRGPAVPLELIRPAAGGDVPRYHVVQPGEHLSAIATAHGLTGADAWRRLFDANPDISDPDRLEAGTRVRLPEDTEALERRALPRPPVAAPRGGGGGGAGTRTGVWDRLAACESGGNWHIATGNGYYGGLQFSLSSWRAVGGTGYPHEHSRATQIAMAERLLAVQGWGAWPSCSRRLGLR